MSVHAASWAWRVDLAALEHLPADRRVAAHVARTVVAKLGDNANDDGEAWPSIATIAYETELGERTVQRSLAALESVGVICRRERPRRSTVYLLMMEGPGAAPMKAQRTGAVPAPIANARMGAADGRPWVPLTTVKGAGAAPRTVREPSEEQTPPAPPPDGEGVESDSLEIELALTVALGRSPVTNSEKRGWRRVAKDLAQAGATADDVTARCAEYRRVWPSAKLTPVALVRHWSMLGGSVDLDRKQADGATLDAWVEKTAWQLPLAAVLDILESRGLDALAIAEVVARCEELLAEHDAGDAATAALVDGRAA